MPQGRGARHPAGSTHLVVGEREPVGGWCMVPTEGGTGWGRGCGYKGW